MNALKLNYPVYTVDKQLLLPAGTFLSKETLEYLIYSDKIKSHHTYPLVKYGTVRDDLLRQMRRPPYDVMFAGEGTVEEVMAMFEKVNFAMPVLQSLDYFKRDDYHTYCHLLVVFVLSALLAKDLLPDYRAWANGVSAGPTHDIGKICVPLNVLRKVAPLTRTERNMIDHHAAAGYVLLSHYQKDPKSIAAVVARDHHERKDGSGIPCGRPLTDRLVEIIVVCDVYDALISPRPYRAMAYDNRTALEEVTKMAEMNKIGWEVVQSLVAHNRKDKPKYREVKVSGEERGCPPSPNFHGVVQEDNGDA